jgi:hypothetical protein
VEEFSLALLWRDSRGGCHYVVRGGTSRRGVGHFQLFLSEIPLLPNQGEVGRPFQLDLCARFLLPLDSQTAA